MKSPRTLYPVTLSKTLPTLFFLLMVVLGQVHASNVPFDLAKFKEVLSDSRLQSPSTSDAVVKDGKFEGFTQPGRFYLAEDGLTLVMATQEDGRDRTELRHNAHFSTGGKEVVYKASLRFDQPTAQGSKPRLHFVQIHIKDFMGNDKGPLMMMTWRGAGEGKNDHIWAKVRQDFRPKKKKNKFYDLGPRPDTFTDLEIRVGGGTLRVFVNGKQMFEDDVSEFAATKCYFKTGCYTRDLQAHAMEFQSLSITKQ